MIEEHEKLLCEGGGMTLSQAGYGGAFNATEDIEDASLAESIVKYAERTLAAESEVSEFKLRMSMMEMGGGTQPHMHPNQVVYFHARDGILWHGSTDPDDPTPSSCIPPTGNADTATTMCRTAIAAIKQASENKRRR